MNHACMHNTIADFWWD